MRWKLLHNKNGKNLFCNYWDDKNTNFNFQKQRIPEILGANHMTYYGNLLLTNDIVKIIGDELRFNDDVRSSSCIM